MGGSGWGTLIKTTGKRYRQLGVVLVRGVVMGETFASREAKGKTIVFSPSPTLTIVGTQPPFSRSNKFTERGPALTIVGNQRDHNGGAFLVWMAAPSPPVLTGSGGERRVKGKPTPRLMVAVNLL